MRVSYPRGEGYPQPQSGDSLCTWGRPDDDYGPRGVSIVQAGHTTEVFFRSPEEHAEWVAEEESTIYKASKDIYEKNKNDVSYRLAALPTKMQLSIQKMRDASGDVDMYNITHLAVAVAHHEKANMLLMVIGDVIQLNILRSVPTTNKLGSVWNAMIESEIANVDKILTIPESKKGLLAKIFGKKEPVLSQSRRKELTENRAVLSAAAKVRFGTNHTEEDLTTIFRIASDCLKEAAD